ncbi:hypothetical protein DFH08DRAFT_697617 [Mycena albidolilacea]|uniref:Uncharacterized protein n=1 Tax=Mycena albidolilacea TaxID=1033008 RepID=A0AAD7ETM2_9AGAR|nr:hypothetical protein DFH08DRAFT_697617 [Mycena albidolilacea]
MDASIGEPFHLASYGVAQRLHKLKTKSQRPTPSVFATHEKIASGSKDGYVTVTAQGDGVHVLDLSTLHPVISHTLGPSASFSGPSVTLSVTEGQENICATYSAIASSAELSSEDCGRAIWMWRENLSSPVGDRASQKKKAAVLPHQISDLYACNSVPPRLLALSPTGDLTILDADLRIRNTMRPLSSSGTLLQSFVFPRESSTFLPGPSGSTAIVLLEHFQDDATSIRILDVSGDNEGREIGKTEIPVKADQITSVSCSPSGYLSVLTQDGCWISFQVELKHDGISVYSAAQPLRLKSFTFIEKTMEASSVGGEVSLVALNTSLVLLTAITPSPTRNIVLLVWDLQYSVLLASHVLPIPSTLSQLPKLSMHLRLVATTTPQALLILSPRAADVQAKSSSARSNILVVPLTVPKTSTIGNAMGRAPAGAQWLVQPDVTTDDALGPARAKVIAAVRSAIAGNNPAAAEKAFFEWEQSERQASSSAGAEEEQPQQAQVALGHPFVRDLLTAILQPTKQATAYSSVLVRTLLERRAVSATMVEGGLLAAFKLRGDWNAIQLCTTHVTDLAESDLISILQFVVAHSREASDAMEVDSGPSPSSSPLGTIPSLPSFLSACVRYSTSPAALRAALHQHLPQPEDVLAVLSALDDWVSRARGAEVISLPPKKSVHKDADGVLVLKDGWRKDESSSADAGAPPLIKVLSFIQTLLDASFLALLQHTPAHRVLRKVLARIEPEIALTEQVELLRGPLEMFARAQAKAVREGKEGKKGANAADWRQRRRLEHEQRSAMAVGGVYQLEELVL